MSYIGLQFSFLHQSHGEGLLAATSTSAGTSSVTGHTESLLGLALGERTADGGSDRLGGLIDLLGLAEGIAELTHETSTNQTLERSARTSTSHGGADDILLGQNALQDPTTATDTFYVSRVHGDDEHLGDNLETVVVTHSEVELKSEISTIIPGLSSYFNNQFNWFGLDYIFWGHRKVLISSPTLTFSRWTACVALN